MTRAHMLMDGTVVADSTDEAAWLEKRATGVTASNVYRIARGTKQTWRSLLDEMLNGAKFRGNRHTRRGHEREAFLIEYAAEWWADQHPTKTVDGYEYGITEDIHASTALIAANDEPRFMATPDGLGAYLDESTAHGIGVEVKSHNFGKDISEVDPDHYAQMQWGMRCTGFEQWLYVREVMGPDGQPTLDDPVVMVIERDDDEIARLEKHARAFLDWWDAEAPMEDDDLPADFDDVVGPWLDAKRDAKAAKDRVNLLEKPVRKLIAERGGGEWKASGAVGGFNYGVTESDELDEEAWQDTDPEMWDEWQRLSNHAEALRDRAAEIYKKPKISTRLDAVLPKGD